MLARIRSGLTYANVMATVAVMIALGGTAYAAATIGSAEIIDDSIQSVDIKNGQVRGPDIGGNAVTSTRVYNDSLTGADINESTLSGVRVSGVEEVEASSWEGSDSWKSAQASCPPGKHAVGTGAAIHPAGDAFAPPPEVAIESISPSRTYVSVAAHEVVPTDASWTVQAIAICAKAE